MAKTETTTEQTGLRKGRQRHFNLYLTQDEYAALAAVAERECREIRWQALKIIRDYLGLSEKTAVDMPAGEEI